MPDYCAKTSQLMAGFSRTNGIIIIAAAATVNPMNHAQITFCALTQHPAPILTYEKPW
jgi:hypothetical protein